MRQKFVLFLLASNGDAMLFDAVCGRSPWLGLWLNEKREGNLKSQDKRLVLSVRCSNGSHKTLIIWLNWLMAARSLLFASIKGDCLLVVGLISMKRRTRHRMRRRLLYCAMKFNLLTSKYKPFNRYWIEWKGIAQSLAHRHTEWMAQWTTHQLRTESKIVGKQHTERTRGKN